MQPWWEALLSDICRALGTAVEGARQGEGPVLLPGLSPSTSLAPLRVPPGSPD